MIKKVILLLTFAIILGSCASRKGMVFMNNAAEGSDGAKAEYASVLQRDDILVITVTSDEPALAAPFNLMYLNMQSNEISASSNSNPALISYLIDQNGEINFPQIGKVQLAGLTRIEAENKLKDLLKKQLANPGVNLRVLNFKVVVDGEVLRPGPIPVSGERITLLEAISTAGGMTIYGKRKDVMIVREKDGVKTVGFVDVTDKDIINSPFYYLSRNDYIYVQPNQTRINSSVVGPNLTVGISALSLIVTIIALSTR